MVGSQFPVHTMNRYSNISSTVSQSGTNFQIKGFSDSSASKANQVRNFKGHSSMKKQPLSSLIPGNVNKQIYTNNRMLSNENNPLQMVSKVKHLSGKYNAGCPESTKKRETMESKKVEEQTAHFNGKSILFCEESQIYPNGQQSQILGSHTNLTPQKGLPVP